MHKNIEVKKIDAVEFNDFFKRDPALCYKGLSDQAMDYLYHTGAIVQSPTSSYYGVYETDELICCVQSDYWSDICTNIHMYVPTKLQHKGTIRRAKDAMIDYLKNNTSYIKAILMVPSVCDHVIITAIAFGLEYEGTIKKCIIWREQPTDMVIYGLDLYKESK